jgi:hypothetical protein
MIVFLIIFVIFEGLTWVSWIIYGTSGLEVNKGQVETTVKFMVFNHLHFCAWTLLSLHAATLIESKDDKYGVCHFQSVGLRKEFNAP